MERATPNSAHGQRGLWINVVSGVVKRVQVGGDTREGDIPCSVIVKLSESSSGFGYDFRTTHQLCRPGLL